LLGLENKPETNREEGFLSVAPNPFPQTVRILYRIKEKGEVILRIYSPMGDLVKTTDLGKKVQGNYETTLSLSGRQGIYILQLTVGKRSYQEKIVFTGGAF
jgi:hypothetical protein